MKRFMILAVIALITLAFASSAVLADWTENFDSYADQAAFNAVWTGTAPMSLVSDQSVSAPNSVYQGTGAQQSYRAVGNDIATSDLYFKTVFYDGGAALGRTYAMVYSKAGGTWAGGLNQILAIGKNNGVATLKYSARVAFGGPNWFTLDGAANRSVGWHTAEIIGKSDGTVDFLIDGILGANKPCANVDFNFVVLGSGLSSSTAMWYDDVTVHGAVPEPGSLLALGTGLIGFLGIIRRKRS